MVRTFTSFGWVAVLCPCLLTSCLQVEINSIGAKVIHQRKDESVILWKERKVGKPGVFEYMGNRTAVLVGGGDPIDFKFHGSSVTMRGKLGSGFTIGSAVAVAADGYYLTAAHCLDEKGLRLVGYNGREIIFAPEVRTVWSGKDRGQDLALVHIAAEKSPYFPLADASGVYPGAEVLVCGAGGLRLAQSAGKIQVVRDRREGSSIPWKAVVHSAPLLKGDSGGPVMNEAGKLVGVTSTGGAFALPLVGKRWVHSYRSGAVWADPDWVQSMIEEDRRKFRGREGVAFTVKPARSHKSPRSGS